MREEGGLPQGPKKGADTPVCGSYRGAWGAGTGEGLGPQRRAGGLGVLTPGFLLPCLKNRTKEG